MPQATQPQNLRVNNATLTPRDLVVWSLAERARRFALVETLGVGAWAVLSDTAYEVVGERFVEEIIRRAVCVLVGHGVGSFRTSRADCQSAKRASARSSRRTSAAGSTEAT